MVVINASEAVIKGLAGKHPDVKKYSTYHDKLPEALVAIAGYGTNADWNAYVDAQVTEGAKVKGRSGAATRKQAETSALSAGESEYLRPNGEKYYPRKWGEHEDVAVLRKAREIQQFVLLYGAPGCGKTALVEGAFGRVHTVLGSADTTLSDFVGSYVAKPEGGYLWVDGPLIKAMENGEVLLIDEIGLIDPKELSGLYSVMDGRDELTITANPERGTVKAAEGFYVISATNPNAPGVRLSEALLSRFTLQVEMTTDWQLARKLGVPARIVSWAQNSTNLWETRAVSWAPQMRELLAYKKLAATFGETFAQQNLLALVPEMDREVLTDTFQRAVGNPDLDRAKI